MSNPSAEDSLLDYYRKFNLKEFEIPDSTYNCTVHFFCTKWCNVKKIERYCNEKFSKPARDNDTIDEAQNDIGGAVSDYTVKGKKIWIDDIRPAPDGFKWIKTVNDFIDYACENGVDDVVLFDTDHDAGEFLFEGGNYVVCFQYLERCGVRDVLIHIHSSNPVGANSIRKIITRNKKNGWREIRNSSRGSS